jgi:hypothetical protein
LRALSIVARPYPFGTRGAQVQILPLRPILSSSSSLAGHSFAVFRLRSSGAATSQYEGTLFVSTIAGAIGLGAANLAVQVDKERATFDAAAATQKLGLLVHPPSSPDTADTGAALRARRRQVLRRIRPPRRAAVASALGQHATYPPSS